MVNITRLKNTINDSGMTMTAIANKSGILKETLYNRFRGVGEFTASEILALSDVLSITNEEREKIFFDREGE